MPYLLGYCGECVGRTPRPSLLIEAFAFDELAEDSSSRIRQAHGHALKTGVGWTCTRANMTGRRNMPETRVRPAVSVIRDHKSSLPLTFKGTVGDTEYLQVRAWRCAYYRQWRDTWLLPHNMHHGRTLALNLIFHRLAFVILYYKRLLAGVANTMAVYPKKIESVQLFLRALCTYLSCSPQSDFEAHYIRAVDTHISQHHRSRVRSKSKTKRERSKTTSFKHPKSMPQAEDTAPLRQ